MKKIFLFFAFIFSLSFSNAQSDTGRPVYKPDSGHFWTLNFDTNTYNFLIQLRAYPPYVILMNQRGVSFVPISLRDHTFALDTLSIRDPNFREIVDSIYKTTWQDSFKLRWVPDSLKPRL